MRFRTVLFLLFVLASGLLFAAPPQQLQKFQPPPPMQVVSGFTVNMEDDIPDPDLKDGKCDVDLVVPGNQCTLRAAVQEANKQMGAQVIGFSCPVSQCFYKLKNSGINEEKAEKGDLDITDHLTIVGKGTDKTIIDGGKGSVQVPVPDRVFQIHSGIVEIKNLTIQNGKVDAVVGADGGGIRVEPAVLVNLKNVILSGNEAVSGGGLSIDSGSKATVDDAQFEGNHASSQGGAIDIPMGGELVLTNSAVTAGNNGGNNGVIENRGKATLQNVSITGNQSGGVLINFGGTLTMTDVAITGNITAGIGGIVNAVGKATLDRVTIDGNTALGSQNIPFAIGGLANGLGGELVMTNSTISGNTGKQYGGLYNWGPAKMTLTDVTVFGNKGTDGGGGLWNKDGTVELVNATVANNTGPDGAGGIKNEGNGAVVTLKNTIIANNTGGNCGGTIASLGHNLDSGNTCQLAADGDLPNKDPLFDPAGLQSNGGPTKTLALTMGSPAIDAGTGDGAPAADQRGVPRPQIQSFDSGAFEIAQSPVLTLSRDKIAFPETVPGETSGVEGVTLSNAGNLPLTVTAVTSGDPFPLGENCSGQKLDAKDTCTVTVSFSPKALQDFAGSLVIKSTGGNKSISLAGTGAEKAASEGPGPGGEGPGESGTPEGEGPKGVEAGGDAGTAGGNQGPGEPVEPRAAEAPGCSCRLIHEVKR